MAQYFLGKAKNPFLGWILPALSLVIGLVISFQRLSFEEPLGEILFWCLLPQIPTVIVLLLLGVAHYGRKNTSTPLSAPHPDEIKRMNIQDL